MDNYVQRQRGGKTEVSYVVPEGFTVEHRQTLRHCIESFSHVIRLGDKVSFGDFASMIMSHCTNERATVCSNILLEIEAASVKSNQIAA